MSKVLIVLTNHKFMLNGDPTGLWLEEFAVPYTALTEAGHEVTVSSVSGGRVPIDPNSEATTEQMEQWRQALTQLESTPAFNKFDADDFDAVYLPGGHGTMFDMPFNDALHAKLYQFDRAGKLIAAVCHGPAVFGNMRDEEGVPFIKGKKVACFTDSEEAAAGGTTKVPFLLESQLRNLGAKHEGAEDWQPHTVQDGRLITGQNPQSSRQVAEQLLKALAE